MHLKTASEKATLLAVVSPLFARSLGRVLCLLTKIAFNGASIQRNHLSRFKKTVAYLFHVHIHACSLIHSANAAPDFTRECNIFSLVSQCSLIYESPSFHFCYDLCLYVVFITLHTVDLSSTKLGLNSVVSCRLFEQSWKNCETLAVENFRVRNV